LLRPKGLDPTVANMAHRALPDAYVTALILRELLDSATVEGLTAWTREPVLLPRCEREEELQVVLTGPEPDHEFGVALMSAHEEMHGSAWNRDRLTGPKCMADAVDADTQPTRANRELLVGLGVNVIESVPSARTTRPEANLDLGDLWAFRLCEDDGLAVERVHQRGSWCEGRRGHAALIETS
jgi:hypothetical protein